jgi:hypothetical protein
MGTHIDSPIVFLYPARQPIEFGLTIGKPAKSHISATLHTLQFSRYFIWQT